MWPFLITPTDTVASKWNQILLNAIVNTKTSPPRAARTMAMVHTAMFDAFAAFDECALSTHTYSRLRRPPAEHKQENWQKAYSYAAYRVLNQLFWLDLTPDSKTLFRDFMCELGYQPDNATFDITKPEGVGNVSAQLVLDSHYGDGANGYATLNLPVYTDFTRYSASNKPSEAPEPMTADTRPTEIKHWQPLTIKGKTQSFLLPHWGLVKPFALEYPWQFRPTEPAMPPSFAFMQQLEEVIQYSAGLSDEEKMICEYWLGGPGSYTPPGIWCDVSQFVSRCNKHSDVKDIFMFFAVSNALYDAGIAAWDCKRKYDSVRPISAIRHLKFGKQIHAWSGPSKVPQSRDMNGEEWLPYQPMDFITPPFSEYVSGHSTFSAAAAYILRSFTQSDAFNGEIDIKKGGSIIEPGFTPKEDMKLGWSTFTEAAEQAGMSRLYGGIHFKDANVQGLELGQKVAECVWEKVKVYFNGKKY